MADTTKYWHISKDGQPRLCHAGSPDKCPLGTVHGASRKEVILKEEQRIANEHKTYKPTPSLMSKKTMVKNNDNMNTVERPSYSDSEVVYLDKATDVIAEELTKSGCHICKPGDQSFEDSVNKLTRLLSTPAMDLFIDKNDKFDAERIARIVLDLPPSIYRPSCPVDRHTGKPTASARMIMTRLHNDWNDGKGKKALKASLAMVLLFKGRCPYCGKKMVDKTDWNYDRDKRLPSGEHIVPVSLKGCTSGTTSIGNTMVVCKDCNQARGSKSLKEWMEEEHGEDAATILDAQLVNLRKLMPYEIPGAREQVFIHRTAKTLRAVSDQLSPRWFEQAASDAVHEIELMENRAYRSGHNDGDVWDDVWVKSLIDHGIDLNRAKARRDNQNKNHRAGIMDAAPSTLVSSEAS